MLKQISKDISAFVATRQKDFNQGFGGRGANVSMVPFVMLFNIFCIQALHLVVCQLHADGFSSLLYLPNMDNENNQ